MRICAVIPTRDEAGCVGSVIRAAWQYVDEVLVIDTGSTDETVELVRALSVARVVEVRGGKGTAIRAALRATDCDVVVFLDADGSHDAADIPLVVAPIIQGRADVVVASRIAGGSDEFDAGGAHLVRRIGLRWMTALINLAFGAALTDSLNGFRAMHRERAAGLLLTASGFEIELEVLVKALASGLRVREVPSHEYHRQWGKSKLPTLRGLSMTYCLIRYLRSALAHEPEVNRSPTGARTALHQPQLAEPDQATV